MYPARVDCSKTASSIASYWQNGRKEFLPALVEMRRISALDFGYAICSLAWARGTGTRLISQLRSEALKVDDCKGLRLPMSRRA